MEKWETFFYEKFLNVSCCFSANKFGDCHSDWNKHWKQAVGASHELTGPVDTEILPRGFSHLLLLIIHIVVIFPLFTIFSPFHFLGLFHLFSSFSSLACTIFRFLGLLFAFTNSQLKEIVMWRLISSHASHLFIFPQRPWDYNRSNDGTNLVVQWQNIKNRNRQKNRRMAEGLVSSYYPTWI